MKPRELEGQRCEITYLGELHPICFLVAWVTFTGKSVLIRWLENGKEMKLWVARNRVIEYAPMT